MQLVAKIMVLNLLIVVVNKSMIGLDKNVIILMFQKDISKIRSMYAIIIALRFYDFIVLIQGIFSIFYIYKIHINKSLKKSANNWYVFTIN